jgi:hypothetical protein
LTTRLENRSISAWGPKPSDIRFPNTPVQCPFPIGLPTDHRRT